jgi:N-acyl homoserine lactone hydrolase
VKLYLLTLGVMRGLNAPVPGYLINTDGDEWILVDTGYAPSGAPDERIIVGPEHDLLRQLAELGVSPGDIGTVACTHFDPDHVGHHGAFTNAEFVVQRDHYALARSGKIPRLEQSRPHWDQQAIHYRLVEGDTTLRPGIELIESGGHIAGHQSVLLRLKETGSVLLAADAIPMTGALDPDTRPVYPFDLEEEEVRRSTKKLVELAHKEQALIICGHDAAQWATLRTAPEFYQ